LLNIHGELIELLTFNGFQLADADPGAVEIS